MGQQMSLTRLTSSVCLGKIFLIIVYIERNLLKMLSDLQTSYLYVVFLLICSSLRTALKHYRRYAVSLKFWKYLDFAALWRTI